MDDGDLTFDDPAPFSYSAPSGDDFASSEGLSMDGADPSGSAALSPFSLYDPLAATNTTDVDASTPTVDEHTPTSPTDKVGGYPDPAGSVPMSVFNPMPTEAAPPDEVTDTTGGPVVRGNITNWLDKLPQTTAALAQAFGSTRAGTNGVGGNRTGPVDLSGGGVGAKPRVQSKTVPQEPGKQAPAATGFSLPTDPVIQNQVLIVLGVLTLLVMLIRSRD